MKLYLISLYLLSHALALPHNPALRGTSNNTTTGTTTANGNRFNSTTDFGFPSAQEAAPYSFGSLAAMLSDVSIPFTFQTATALATIPEATFATETKSANRSQVSRQPPILSSQGLTWPASAFGWPFRPGPPTRPVQVTTAQQDVRLPSERPATTKAAIYVE